MDKAAQNLPPLAEYFWIAGIDSISYGEHMPPEPPRMGFAPSEGLIEAAEPDESENPFQRRSNGTLQAESRSASPSRLTPSPNATPTGDGRLSVASQNFGGSLGKLRSSNSSTSTLANSLKVGMSDADFDKALFKFAAERESFLEDLSFSAGTIVNNKPVIHPRAQKVINDDANIQKAPSLRRRISLRDLSSMRRAPSVVNRAASIRTSRRMSNYNSVIPVPQPLNPTPNMHPLKRKFEPVLLDRYPPRAMLDEIKKRGPFPDYVPMFAFPNDVNIVSSDERPRSTWHGFTMTGGDNSQLHAICVIIWIPLNPKAAEDLERRCEEWRRDNMTNEERELASSLGERLALERAKLSRLLSRLPTVVAHLREQLDDEIVETEERISLMADLLRPVRHGAASKIEGLTDGETGLWIPRAFGILGKDASLTSFWKEWLKAIVVPMMNGAIQRVPPSSPKVGIWQPLEKYVVNLCAEAPAPDGSKTQVEVALRELRLYARKEAPNELPGSRNNDLWALFRSMSLQNVVTMFEFALSESRIILLSSHTAMLHCASRALVSLLYPFTWSGIFIPVLPARLLSAIEAPCPYIVGIERRYDKIELPEEDFVLVDLDSDSILSSNPPTLLPRAQRRKLVSLLQLAAGHHNRYGVPVGPPQYVVEAFPNDSMVSENSALYSAIPPVSTLAKLVNLTSTSFGGAGASDFAPRPLVFNGFTHSKNQVRTYERPTTSGTIRGGSPPSPKSPSTCGYPQTTGSSIPRQDSGFTLTATLRGKRSGNLDSSANSRRSSSVSARFPLWNPTRGDHLLYGYKFGFERTPTLRRPSVPLTGHSPSPSTSSLTDSQSIFNQYPPSVYSPSTLAASTIMPNMLMQPVRNTDTTRWVEGHCMVWKQHDVDSVCSICEEKSDEGIYTCSNCSVASHMRCSPAICLPCPVSFYPDQIRAAFVRCFASLLYTYRRFLMPATGDGKKAGKIYKFNMEGFLKSMPHECADYVKTLEQTQAFSEFIHERESKKATDPQLKLFDEIILSKKNRGKTSFFSSKQSTNFLYDTTEHLWRTSTAITPSTSPTKMLNEHNLPQNRVPAKLDPLLLREPRVNQGVPKITPAKPQRKPTPTNIPTITKQHVDK
ncbi:AEX-3 domain-containing protein [Tirmania nivea]|nr:AEX-3 domain-containing protein [Tirmania nivea]